MTQMVLMKVIAPLSSDAHQERQMFATTISRLLLDPQSPLSFEIAHDDQGVRFLLRSPDVSMQHAMSQLRACSPQVTFVPVPPQEDPAVVRPEDSISAVCLTSQRNAVVHIPMSHEASQADPLLGVLAALTHQPSGHQTWCQIIAQPASPRQQQHVQRRVRQMQRDWQTQRAGLPMKKVGSSFLLVLAFCWLGLYGLLHWLWTQVPWLAEGWSVLTQGQSHPLLRSPWMLLSGLGAVGLSVLIVFITGHQRLTLTGDPNRMQAILEQPLMSVQLRCVVIGPATPRVLEHHRRLSLSWFRAQRRQDHTERTARQMRMQQLRRVLAAYRQSCHYTHTLIAHPLARWELTLPLPMRTSMAGWWASRYRMLVTAETLTAWWHLPPSTVLQELPQVEQRRARSFLVPASLVQTTSEPPAMGISEHAGYRHPFRLPADCLRMHTLIAGKSGEGKSTCMEQLARAAMRQGGLVVIDPHGDLVMHLLHIVEPERVDDVVLIDLADEQAAIAFNPLDVTMGRGRDKAISDLLKTLSHIWVNAWGSRMEIAFEYALRTLYEANRRMVERDPVHGPTQQYTLLDVMAVLTDEQFCHRLLEQVDDPFILRWWRIYYDPLSMSMQRDRSDPVLSKVAKFESKIARRIVGQSQSSIRMSDLIREQRLVFITLAKGEVGDDVARLLGATYLGMLQMALQEQAELHETNRQPLGIMVDEFQVLTGVDWAALAELRKYGAAFYLATQSLDYLHELQTSLLPVVLANVKQYIAFHLSAPDARRLAPELGVEPTDLIHLDSHHCYLRLTSGGRRLPTFSGQFHRIEPAAQEQAQRIRERCRARYGQPVARVDVLLQERLIRALGAAPPPRMHDEIRRPVQEGKKPRKRTRKKQQEKQETASLHATSEMLHPMPWKETVGTPFSSSNEWEEREHHEEERQA